MRQWYKITDTNIDCIKIGDKIKDREEATVIDINRSYTFSSSLVIESVELKYADGRIFNKKRSRLVQACYVYWNQRNEALANLKNTLSTSHWENVGLDADKQVEHIYTKYVMGQWSTTEKSEDEMNIKLEVLIKSAANGFMVNFNSGSNDTNTYLAKDSKEVAGFVEKATSKLMKSEAPVVPVKQSDKFLD